MNLYDVSVAAALCFQLITIALWLQLRRHAQPPLWWGGLIALLLIVMHCTGYCTGRLTLSWATAVSNSLLILLLVSLAKRNFAQVAHYKEEVAQHGKLLTAEHNAAMQLTKLLNDYKAKIQYYEDQAARNGLPLHP